jgi:predicted Ser/Thr protein kinase
MSERAFGDGRYTVVRELGRGGQKVVYLVHDRVLDRACALALIEEELGPEAVARLQHEAQSLARMGTHPNVVTVHDMGQENGRPFVVNEYVEGGDVGRELERAQGPLPIERAVKIGSEILRALAFIHEKGIVHRDLKPSNVWIAGDGTAKLGDFGLALAPNRSRLTLSNTVTGTPGYVSPEQLENRLVDGRSDLYSLGCLLYELLTGRPPFIGTVVSVISQHLHATPSPPSKLDERIPSALSDFVLSLLAKAPDQRPPSAPAALDRLEMALDPTRSDPKPADPRPPIAATPRPRVWIAGLGVIGALAIALLALPRGQDPEKPRRVVIVPTRDVGVTVNSTVAWALASRLVEVTDRYREFRPVSHAGLLAARFELLGRSEVPDETAAQKVASKVLADTVAAISIAKGSVEGDITVAIHVFATDDAVAGVSTPRERIAMADLDADGPTRLGERLAHALARQWGKSSLTDEAKGMEDRATPFDAFQAYLGAQEYCVIGRYQRCEELLRRALERDPENPLFHALMLCALSYQGRDAELDRHFAIAIEGRARLPSGLHRHHAQAEILWAEAERLRAAGDMAGMRAKADAMLRLFRELVDVWADPWGYLYAGATLQYFLEDSAGAKRMYAIAREQGPMLYPGYYEEAKLARGDGRSEEGNREAAKLLFTFIECNPTSDLVPVAWEHISEWRLTKPTDPLPCARVAGR